MHVRDDRPSIDGRADAPAPRRGRSQDPARTLIAQRLADPDAVTDLQRHAGNAAVVQLLADDEAPEARSPVLDVVGHGSGQALDDHTRAGMEHALGGDLSDVRVHTDSQASASASAVQAHAYTVGNDIVFQSGQYQPDSPTGQRMLAHELTHVVQQRSGPVAGTPTGDGISVSDPSDSFERAAESNADRFMSAGGLDAHAGAALSSPGEASGGATSVGASAQREAAVEEEDQLQGAWVQREAAPEEMDEELKA